MIRNKDFALLYAGRAVFDKNDEFVGVVVGWNDMHGVILGVDHADGWSSWGANDMSVYGGQSGCVTDMEMFEENFPSYEYHNAGTLYEPTELMDEVEAPKHKTIGELIEEHEGVRGIQFSTDEHGNVQAAYIRGKHGDMRLVSMGEGLENVSSKI